MVRFLFNIARKSAWILVAAMIVALFSGLMLVRYQLFSWISYGLIRDIHVFFILIVLIPVFYLHTLGGIMMFLKRKGLADKKILTASVIIGWTAVFLVFGFVYSYTAPATSGNNAGINNTGQLQYNPYSGRNSTAWFSGQLLGDHQRQSIRFDKLPRHPSRRSGGNYSLLREGRNGSVCNKEFGGFAFILCNFAS